ncbi:MAG: dTDP-4-dehydrorhamnose 3,5-epimerase family protein, partial [Pseudomonadota bacterium]
PTHVDARGEVMEIYDERWGFHPEPMVYCYQFTVRPGVVKGWGLHKKHDDRYVLLKGKVDLVMYDARAGSPTEGRVQRVTLNEYDRQIVRIPAFVWHADHNYGEEEAVILNFPTQPYDHADPDKWVLPIDTPLIPYDFGPSARAR